MNSLRTAVAAVALALASAPPRAGAHAPLDLGALSAGEYVAIWAIALDACALLILVGAAPAALVVLALSGVLAAVARPREALGARAKTFVGAGVACVLLAALVATGPIAQSVTVLALVPIAALCVMLGWWSRDRIERMVCDADRALDELMANERRARVAMIRMQDLRETVDDVHWEADEKLCLRYVSPAFEKLAGIPPQLVLGLDPYEIAERYLGRYGRIGVCAARMEAHKALAQVRLVWCDRERRRRYVLVCAVPRFSAFGRFIGYRGVMLAASRG